MEILIENDDNVLSTLATSTDVTALMALTRNENITLDCFKKVLKNKNIKKSINKQDSVGQTAIFHLIKHTLFYITNEETKKVFINKIKLLIESGADILTISTRNSNISVIEYFNKEKYK